MTIDRRVFPRRLGGPLALALSVAVAPAATQAATIAVQVQAAGEPTADAVISAEPRDRTLSRPEAPTAVMDQRERAFVPHVLPVLRGTTVRFPNSDATRHQVYSFSEARTFELSLYEGSQADPVVFNRTGTVTLGCNIHDWMLGFIRVVDTPAFARTGADGRARLENLPAGHYRVRLWHPRLVPGEEPAVRTLDLGADSDVTLGFELALEPPPERPQRGFGNDSDDGDSGHGFDY